MNRNRLAVDDLHETMSDIDKIAAFAHLGIVGPQIDDLGKFVLQIDVDGGRLAVIKAFGKKRDGCRQRRVELLAGT
ncbi:hypothetical protein D9M69_713650 [compost metagenome]